MRRKRTAALGGFALVACLAVAVSCRPRDGAALPVVERCSPGTPAFAAGPTVTRRGRAVLIRFEAAEPTDATVEILGPDGRVVRHLASGVLGPNAPTPFTKGSLGQVVAWLGDDDAGKRAPAGCRVRVALGLGAELDRVLTWEEPGIYSRGVVGLACGPKGSLYVMQGHVWQKNCGSPELVAFSRAGRYVRTLVPWGEPFARAAGTAEASDGKRTFGETRPAGLGRQRRQVMCVAGGRLLFVAGRASAASPSERPRRHVHALGLDGAPGPDSFGPALPGHTARSFSTFLAVTPDRRTVYLAGLATDKGNKLHHVVYRARWDEPELAPFLGEMHKAGKDDAHLNDPRGLAVDARGRLYVCDFGNDRIQVFGRDGKLARTIRITGPEQVRVHPKTGELYVLSVQDKGTEKMYGGLVEPTYEKKSVVKLAGLEAGAGRLAELALPERKLHLHDAGPILALDAGSRTPRLWIACVGRQEPTDYLWLVADRGDRLQRLPTPVPRYRWPFGTSPGSMVVDRAREELYLAGRAIPAVMRIDGRTGDARCLQAVTADVQRRPDGGAPNLPTDHLQVAGLDLDRAGRLYVRLMKPWSGAENWIRRYDRAGRRVPFAKAGDELQITQPSHGYHPGSFAVAPDGSLYVVNQVPGGKHRSKSEHNVLDVYDPDGKLVKPKLIPFLTSAAWGPRFAPDGSMYLTEAVRPRGLAKPNESVGSLVKLKGRAPRLRYGKDADAKKARYELRRAEKNILPAEIDGLEWAHYGVSPVPFGHCVCPASAFDVDAHSRACVPDALAHGVRVVDAAGNLMLRIGGYGNRDTHGLRSPTAVALSGEAAYIYDAANRRVLRLRWTYARESFLSIP